MKALDEVRAEWALGSPGTAKRHAEVAEMVLNQVERDLNAEIAAILDDWFTRYRRAGRLDATLDEDMFLALYNRLLPLTPGEPVMFQELGQRRWFHGTFEGPVDNPEDPHRSGDVIVHSRSGRRASVFLSGVRRT